MSVLTVRNLRTAENSSQPDFSRLDPTSKENYAPTLKTGLTLNCRMDFTDSIIFLSIALALYSFSLRGVRSD